MVTTASEPIRATPPGPVRASFWILIASAALRLVVVIPLVATWNAQTAAVMKGLHYNSSQAHSFLIANIVLDVLFCGIYVLFAYMIRNGRNWARITLTVIIVVFGLYSILSSADVYTLASVIIELVAVGLLYMTSSKEYFAAVKAGKQA